MACPHLNGGSLKIPTTVPFRKKCIYQTLFLINCYLFVFWYQPAPYSAYFLIFSLVSWTLIGFIDYKNHKEHLQKLGLLNKFFFLNSIFFLTQKNVTHSMVIKFRKLDQEAIDFVLSQSEAKILSCLGPSQSESSILSCLGPSQSGLTILSCLGPINQQSKFLTEKKLN